MGRTSCCVGLGVLALALYVALGALNLFWGNLNQDEGWYLYAARRVHEGGMPYRDFAFTQGPVMPYVYAQAHDWVARWGVAGGRLFTGLLGLGGALWAALLAGRLAPREGRPAAVALALLLLAGNVYQSYFTTVVKTYSLCIFLLAAGWWALTFAGGRMRLAASFAGGLLLALAAGTRLSAGVTLPVAGLFLLVQRRRLGDGPWLAFGLGGGLGLGLFLAPFALVAREGLLFGLLEYHAGRSAGGWLPWLVFKAGFVSRVVQAYFFPLVLAAGLAVLRWLDPVERRPAPSSRGVPEGFPVALWLAVAAITLAHLAAQFPYDDYQAIAFPLFVAALAAALVRYLVETVPDAERARPWRAWLMALVFLGSVAGAFSSPINQEWMVFGRDRIWWRLKPEPSLKTLRDLGLWLGKQAGFNETLLTQDTYLAVEAGLRVPSGMELGPFSYFPDMPTERARTLRVLNRELMLDLLRTTDASLAAFSGYGLAIRGPDVQPLSEEEQEELQAALGLRYNELFHVPDFGQGPTVLRVFRARPPEPP